MHDGSENTALHFCETADMAILLVENGVNIHETNIDGETAIKSAYDDGFQDVVDYLTSLGCKLEIPEGEDIEDVEYGDEGDEDDEGILDEACEDMDEQDCQ